MHDRRALALPGPLSPGDGPVDQRGVVDGREGPADSGASEAAKLDLSFRGGVLGHVSEPEPVRPICCEDPIDQIGVRTFICQRVAESTGPRNLKRFHARS